MIHDPVERGRQLATLYFELTERLFADLEESGLLPVNIETQSLRDEWNAFALYACVRALVAAGGFNIETGQAIDAFHEAVLDKWAAESSDEQDRERRALVSVRYGEYGGIGQAGGAAGADTVTRRLGEAAARHMSADDSVSAPLAEIVGSLHESLVEGATEAIGSAG
jgi:hypothetical protein